MLRVTEAFLGAEFPLVAAPMAGGPSTVKLATAVAAAGAFPFLAAGYKTVDALAAEVDQLAGLDAPFGVNLFVPNPAPIDAAAYSAYVRELEPVAAHYGVTLDPEPIASDDAWEAKLAYLRANPVPVVSFTFGLPKASEISPLQRAGSLVVVTVTSPEEALAACAEGADALVVQGPAAGGHSATFEPSRSIGAIATDVLVRQVRAAVSVPLIAAGGVDGPDAVRALREAGAAAIAVGTMLLRTDEAGTSANHRAALADPTFTETVLTRAFTGRPARALRNAFTDRHSDGAPVAYPAVHFLTKELRRAAGLAGDLASVHLWAGTGYRSATSGPVAETLRRLAADL